MNLIELIPTEDFIGRHTTQFFQIMKNYYIFVLENYKIHYLFTLTEKINQQALFRGLINTFCQKAELQMNEDLPVFFTFDSIKFKIEQTADQQMDLDIRD